MAIETRTGADGKPRYYVRFDTRDPVTGARQRHRVPGSFTSKKTAEQAERKAMLERDTGTWIEPSKTTVGELLDQWLATEAPRGVAPENLPAYEQVIRLHLKPALGTIPLQKLTTRQIELFVADLRASGKSRSLIAKCIQRLNSALRMAKRWGLIHTNPAEGVKAPMVPAKPPMVWTPPEIARFLATAKADSQQHYLYFSLALEIGARTSELLGLSWQDVDWERGTLRIGQRVVRLLHGVPFIKPSAKTTAGHRTVKLTPSTLADLRAFRTVWEAKQQGAATSANGHELIFVTASGKPLNPSHIKLGLERLIKLAGVPRLTPHELRKTNITLTLAGGANPKAVAQRVGHKDVALTLRVYSAVTTSMEDEVLGIIEAVRAAPVQSAQPGG